jgi:hypothetical protein
VAASRFDHRDRRTDPCTNIRTRLCGQLGLVRRALLSALEANRPTRNTQLRQGRPEDDDVRVITFGEAETSEPVRCMGNCVAGFYQQLAYGITSSAIPVHHEPAFPSHPPDAPTRSSRASTRLPANKL